LLLAAERLHGAPLAYVPNEGSASISVIDTATDRVVATLAIGRKPRGIAIAKDGSLLFVADQPTGLLLVHDLRGNRLRAQIPLGASPEAIQLSPDGKLLAAAIEEANEIVLVDTGALALVRRIATKGKNPEHAVWSLDGR
jgi:YVTN family beta-propeller protein